MTKEKEKRTEKMTFRCTENERKIIEEKAELANYSHIGEYIRRQLINGNVLQLKDEWYDDIIRQVSGMANNLNQIARHINETKTIYSSDISDMRKTLNGLQFYTERIEEAVEKIYGNNQNKTDLFDPV